MQRNVLIVERSNAVLQLNKNNTGTENKDYVLEGIFGSIDVMNRNSRIYTEDEYLPQIEALQPKIKARKLLGELDHPKSFETSLNNASHIIEELYYDRGSKNIMGKIRLLNTHAGQQAKALVDAGVPLHISSRAAGSVGEGNKVKIQQLFTYDLVNEPGFENAELKRINESLNITDDNIGIFECKDDFIVPNYLKNTQEQKSYNEDKNMNNISADEFNKFTKHIEEQYNLDSNQIKELTERCETLEEKLKTVIGYANYLATQIEEGVNTTNEKLDTAIEYTEYVAENVNDGINYTQYVAENLNNSIKYTEYVAENLDKSIEYTEYVAENLDKSIEYSEYVAENVNSISSVGNVNSDVNLTSYADKKEYMSSFEPMKRGDKIIVPSLKKELKTDVAYIQNAIPDENGKILIRLEKGFRNLGNIYRIDPSIIEQVIPENVNISAEGAVNEAKKSLLIVHGDVNKAKELIGDKATLENEDTFAFNSHEDRDKFAAKLRKHKIDCTEYKYVGEGIDITKEFKDVTEPTVDGEGRVYPDAKNAAISQSSEIVNKAKELNAGTPENPITLDQSMDAYIERVRGVLEKLDEVNESKDKDFSAYQSAWVRVNTLISDIRDSKFVDKFNMFEDPLKDGFNKLVNYTDELKDLLEFEASLKTNESKNENESDTDFEKYTKSIQESLNAILTESKAEENKPAFLNFVSKAKQEEFAALDKDKQSLVENAIKQYGGYLSEGQIHAIWNNVLLNATVDHQKEFLMKAMPDSVKHLWENASPKKQSELIAQSKYQQFNTEYQVKNFWQTRDWRETSYVNESIAINNGTQTQEQLNEQYSKNVLGYDMSKVREIFKK